MSHNRQDFPLGATIKATGTFVDSVGDPVDPDVVTVVVRDILAGTSDAYVYLTDVEVVRDSVGVFSLSQAYPTPGIWSVTVTGTKDSNTASNFVEFGIHPGVE